MPINVANQVLVKSRVSSKRQSRLETRAESTPVAPPPQRKPPEIRPDYAAKPKTKLTVGAKNLDHPLLRINGQDSERVKRSQYMADMLTSTK